MFQRILIPLNIAQKNQAVLTTVAEMARQNKATVLLLHKAHCAGHVADPDG